MNDFKESRHAFRGPFSKASVALSTSTRQVPLDELPAPVQEEIPISQLPLAGPIFGQEMVPIVQDGITKRATAADVASAAMPPINLTKVGSLIYVAAIGQTAFSLSVPDKYGHSYRISDQNSIQVTAAGARLAPGDGAGFGGFTVNVPSNTVNLTTGFGTAGNVVIIDIFMLADAPFAETATLSLTYAASLGQTVFSLSTPDHYGTSYTLLPNDVVRVTVGGMRLAYDDGTGFGGFTVVVPLNSVILSTGFGTDAVVILDGDVVIIDVLVPVSTAPPPYTLPTASTTVLGGVKIDGTTVTISGGGVISASSGAGPSSANPRMDSVADPGSSGLFSRGDHVHPTDTSRYAATNPSGFITDAPNNANMYARQGAGWISFTAGGGGGATVTISPTPPVAPTVGNLWWDSTGGQMYIRYDDGSTSQWVPVVNQSGGFFPITGGVVGGPVDLAVQTISAAATTTINRILGENVSLTFGTNISTLTITNWPPPGTTGKLRLVIKNTGGTTIAWPAGTIWPGGAAPTLSGTGKTDIVLLMTDNVGTTIYGSIVGQDYR